MHRLHLRFGMAILGCVFHANLITSTWSAESSDVEFNRDIAPLLAKNCVACHNSKKPEGGLNLESYDALMKGGDSGAAVVASSIDSSSLLTRVTDVDDLMPPPDNAVGANQLTEQEVALIQQWINSGAVAPSSMSAVSMQWQPLPPGVHPVYALSVSPDGNYVAMGRGNQAFVQRQFSTPNSPTFELLDPAVASVLNDSHPTAETVPQTAHLDIVQSIAFSPDSMRLATGGFRTVKIWRRQLEPVHALTSVSNNSRISLISPDGSRVATVSQEHSLELVDLRTGQAHRLLKNHAASITAIAWSLDGTAVLSADDNGGLGLTLADNHEFRSLTVAPAEQPIQLSRLVAWEPNRLLAITSEAKLAEIVLDGTAATAATVQLVEGWEQVTAIAKSNAESPLAAVGLANGTCRIINAADLLTQREVETGNTVSEIAFSPDGMFMATANGESHAQLWRTADATLVAALDKDYLFNQRTAIAERNQARQKSLVDRLTAKLPELTKASDQEQEATKKVQETRDKAAEELAAKTTELDQAGVAVAEAEKAITDAEAAVAEAMKLVETRKAELEAKKKAAAEAEQKKVKAAEELAKRDQALAAATDSAMRAAARIPEMEQAVAAEQARLADLQTISESLKADPAAKYQAKQVAFSGDNSRVVVADGTGQIHLFSILDGRPEANLISSSSTTAVVATSDNRLVSLNAAGVAETWDLNLPWRLERTIGNFRESPFSDRITALHFSPDGKSLAVGSGPPSRFGDVKILDVDSGQTTLDLGEAHSDTVLALQFSPDGRRLATAGADKLCRIYELPAGTSTLSLEGHTHHILSLAWKDDGQSLVTASADNSIKVWNTETGTQDRTIAGFNKEVTAIAFVGQSNQFAATSASGEAKLFDAGNGNAVRAFAGATGPLATLAISPDGTLCIAGGQSGDKWIWQIADGKLLP